MSDYRVRRTTSSMGGHTGMFDIGEMVFTQGDFQKEVDYWECERYLKFVKGKFADLFSPHHSMDQWARLANYVREEYKLPPDTDITYGSRHGKKIIKTSTAKYMINGGRFFVKRI